MKIKAIIIEDEEPARELISNFLKDYDEIELIGGFCDGFTGLKAINELLPDLVFLDIQMPKLTGFEVLEFVQEPPVVIFTTAYDQYAIKAFEANAADYLLKPFSRERFKQAVKKAIEKIHMKNHDIKAIDGILKTYEETPSVLERIAVRKGSQVKVLQTFDVIYIEAYGDYVKIYNREGSFLKEKTMKYFETHLEKNKFVRIHRSYIVNVAEINKIEYYDKESYMVVMKDNTKLKASTSGYKLLREAINL